MKGIKRGFLRFMHYAFPPSTVLFTIENAYHGDTWSAAIWGFMAGLFVPPLLEELLDKFFPPKVRNEDTGN